MMMSYSIVIIAIIVLVMSDAGSQISPRVVPSSPPPPYYPGPYQTPYYYYVPQGGNVAQPPYYTYPPPTYVYGSPANETPVNSIQSATPITQPGPSRRKKLLYIALCCCCLAVLIFIAIFIYAVIQVTAKSTGPCSDFFSYACEKWKSVNASGVMTKGHAVVQQEVTDINTLDVMILLMTNYTPGFVHSTTYTMLNACLNEDLVQMKGKAPLVDFLNSLGGWPMVEGESWTGNFDKAMHVLGDLTRIFGFNGLFSIDVIPNMLDDMKPVIYVQGTSGFLIPIDPSLIPYVPRMKSQTTRLEEIIFEIVDTIKSVVGEQRKFVTTEIQSMIFLWQLIIKTKQEKFKIEPEILTVGDLSSHTKMNWEIFLTRTFLNIEPIHSNQKIYIFERILIKKLCKKIQKSFKPRTLVNFIIFIAIRPLLWHLPTKFQKLSQDLNDEFGIKTSKNRGDWCIHTAMEHLPYLITNLHAEHYFQQEHLDIVSDITSTILKTYIDELKKNEWLTASSKAKIVDKISSLKIEIGFPSCVKNETTLEEIFHTLNLSTNEHFHNVISSSELNSYYKFAYLNDEQKAKTIWRMSPLAVNAWYLQFANMIQIFAGLLRAANVTSKSTLAHQYGVLGSIIAHEITHALDYSGLKIDKHGKRGGSIDSLEGPLLDKKSAHQFFKKTDCLARQYKKYCVNSKCIKADKTINENLADNSGTRIAFLAFMKKVKENSKNKHKDDQMSPEMQDESLKKQFFYYFTRVWCSDDTIEHVKIQIDYDNHSPNQFRVIGTLANMPEFAEEYECSPFDPMSKKKKCKVW